MTPKHRTRVRVALTLLLSAVALLIFVVSYDGLIRFAHAAGIRDPWALAFPLMVDFSAAMVALAAWYAHALGHKAPAARAFAIALMLLSAFFQLVPADTMAFTAATWMAHGIAPPDLFGLFEVLLWALALKPARVRATVARATATAPAKPSAAPVKPPTAPVKPRAPRKPRAPAVKAPPAVTVPALVLPPFTATALA